MPKTTPPEPISKPIRLPLEVVRDAEREATRIKRDPKTVLLYWLRLGQRTEPEITSVLP